MFRVSQVKSLKYEKKSQIFMLDVVFSFVLILIAVSLSFNYYITGYQNADIYNLNKNVLGGFTNTRINSLNDDEIRVMFAMNKIKNIENTVAQQVIEFYEEGNVDYAENLTRIYVEDYVDKQMNFNITLENSSMTVVLFQSINRPEIEFFDSSIVAVSKEEFLVLKIQQIFMDLLTLV